MTERLSALGLVVIVTLSAIVAPPVQGQIDGSYFGHASGAVLSTPQTFGGGWGDVYFGAGVFRRQRYHHNVDGAVFLGMGLGDPRRLLGAEVTLASYSTRKRGFFTRTAASLRLHRQLGDDWSVAVGAEHLIRYGPNYAGQSLFGAIGRRWVSDRSFLPQLSLTAGAGTGRFGSEEAFDEGERSIGPFGSVAVTVMKPVAFLAEWRQDLTLAGSLVPVPGFPFRLTAGVVDLLGTAGDGARFAMSAGVDTDISRFFRRHGAASLAEDP